MKIIRNNYFPFDGWQAMNVFGILFVREYARLTDQTLNHERIHTEQIGEIMLLALILAFPLVFFGLWWLPPIISLASFYFLYGLEFVIKFWKYDRDVKKTYRNLSFEREAYANQNNLDYLIYRTYLNWTEYL